MRHFRKSSISHEGLYEDHHRFEHWYRDRTAYFITARCRNGTHAFASEAAKQIFWDRCGHYWMQFGFEPWIVSLVENHYHKIGYLGVGENLGPMMQRIHGSVAKLVNDTLTVRLMPFWYDAGKQGYFDGCLRDVLQLSRAYRYTQRQAVRHGIVRDFREYAHTRRIVSLERAVELAIERRALMEGVPYARYERKYGHQAKACR